MLAVYVGLVRVAALLGWHAPVPGPQGGLLYEAWFGGLEATPIWSAAAAAALVWLQALLVNRLADAFRLMGERNWLPGMCYALVASALPDFLFLSAPLVAATFLPLALGHVFGCYKIANASARIFDAALWVAVAGLFYPPALWLLAAVVASVYVMRSIEPREQIVLLSGAFVPYFLGWLWYFWGDQGGLFRQRHWSELFRLSRLDLPFDAQTLLRTALLGLLLLVFIFGLGPYFQRKLIQTQKAVTALYWLLFTAGISVLFRPDWAWAHFLLPATAAGTFLAFSFQGLRNRLLAEVLHLCLLAFVFFIQFFPR